MPHDARGEDRQLAEQAADRYAEATADGAAADIEALCAAHPDLARELRALHERQARWGGLVAEQAADPALDREAGRGDGPSLFHRSGAGRAAEPARGLSFAGGETVGGFRLVKFLGRGGMGEVWEAEQQGLRRRVALKFLLNARFDERVLQYFLREARAGGRVRHPNVVATIASGSDGGVDWIAQELVRGSRSLRDAIEDLRRLPQLPPAYHLGVARLVEGVARGMQAAHEAGVVHRDLKPQNILVDERDQPRIVDFGLARVADESMLSKSGEVVGTWHYMSPEQVLGSRAGLDHRSDIFSLGVVLYELATLERPFGGDSEAALARRIVQDEPADPRSLRSQCPRDLAVVCLKALEKRPEARYQSMDQFAEDLRRVQAHEPIRARPAGQLERARKWFRRNPALGVGLAAGALFLVSVSTLAIVALVQARRAELAAEESRRKTADVLALSAQKEHDDLVAEAGELWPAHPEMVPACEDWLRRANELIEGRPESRDRKRRPSLAEHKAKLAELRARAKPMSEEELRVERESHPLHAKLVALRAELAWRSRMLGLEPWPSEVEVESAMAREPLPDDAELLDGLARPLVDPAKPVHGEELRALVLARRAVAAASEAKRAGIRATLAWALHRAGRAGEALEQARAALAEPGGDALVQAAADLEEAVAAWSAGALAQRRAERDRLSDEVAALALVVGERRTFLFDDPEEDWWNRLLSKLVADVERLRDPKAGLMHDVLAEPFGWGVARRLAFAKSIEERSVAGPVARRAWAEASEAIRNSPRYDGLVVAPQLGLLPIGPDPDSGLWEFAHLQTGAAAARGADGRLALAEDAGLVLVLIPGGTFWMGAQDKPGAPNHDPLAEVDESPVHLVELSPYFLAKHEMTQAQWLRVAAGNPSYYQPPDYRAPTLLHPVEQVSWRMCFDLLRRIGLSLPSEAQWEHAARAGTSTAWWTGQARESLRGKVNLADQTARKAGAPWPDVADWPDLEDGSVAHAPVGSYAANAFGLHEVAGNVWEWCLDGFDPRPYGDKPVKDPLAPWASSSNRMMRGGGYASAAALSRSANRNNSTPEYRAYHQGLRPARPLEGVASAELAK